MKTLPESYHNLLMLFENQTYYTIGDLRAMNKSDYDFYDLDTLSDQGYLTKRETPDGHFIYIRLPKCEQYIHDFHESVKEKQENKHNIRFDHRISVIAVVISALSLFVSIFAVIVAVLSA